MWCTAAVDHGVALHNDQKRLMRLLRILSNIMGKIVGKILSNHPLFVMNSVPSSSCNSYIKRNYYTQGGINNSVHTDVNSISPDFTPHRGNTNVSAIRGREQYNDLPNGILVKVDAVDNGAKTVDAEFRGTWEGAGNRVRCSGNKVGNTEGHRTRSITLERLDCSRNSRRTRVMEKEQLKKGSRRPRKSVGVY
ncbi:hypothetical protein K438DRAFT_1772267 [Mycena galopus ATCC 62051]|nr:hypothetical protein K438DRAFT_1772267 [Mycena galopus ATCC 62051]